MPTNLGKVSRFPNLQSRDPDPTPLSGALPERKSKPRASDEPMTGWALVSVWLFCGMFGWAVVYAVGLAIYEAVLWLS